MPGKRYGAQEIINKLREAEVLLGSGYNLNQACRRIGVSKQTLYRWRQEYGGLRMDQAKRFKDLEKENGRLKRAVAELTLDNQILKEAAEGNY